MERDRNFFQIFLSTDGAAPTALPPLIEAASAESRAHLRDFHYRRWDMTSLRDFLTACFAKEVLAAFDALMPLAYKADLGRYCLLYHYGGWYSDISLKIVSADLAPLARDVGLCFFRDYGEGMPSPHGSSFDCQNSLIYAQAGHPVMARCIQKIIHNVQHQFYGMSSTAPTGPSLFGSVLAESQLTNAKQVGFFLPLTQGFLNRNLAYVSDTGQILAWHKTTWHPSRARGGDLSSLGLSATNNYNQLWRERRIYAKPNQ